MQREEDSCYAEAFYALVTKPFRLGPAAWSQNETDCLFDLQLAIEACGSEIPRAVRRGVVDGRSRISENDLVNLIVRRAVRVVLLRDAKAGARRDDSDGDEDSLVAAEDEAPEESGGWRPWWLEEDWKD